jgi:hypothetical protein
MKHSIIKEIIFQCEIQLEKCFLAESYTPRACETYQDSLKEAKKEGWCIRQGKTCCPQCKKALGGEKE